jgi:hypothetical protein
VQRLVHLQAELPAGRQQRVHWVHWRRAHQATARRCHIARRAHHQPPLGAPALVVVAVPGTPTLTDTHWAAVAALLPTSGCRGRPYHEHRRIVEGMLWVMHTGGAWRELPMEFGAWQTVYSRYVRWRREGLWARMLAVLEQSAPSAPT